MTTDTRTTLAAKERLARQEIRKFAPGWSFEWSRAVKQGGVTRYRTRVIAISKPITEQNDDMWFIEVLKHELGHAIAGAAAGHGTAWKRAVRDLGGTPSRCHDGTVTLRYQGVCPNGHTGQLARRSRLMFLGCCVKCWNRSRQRNRFTWTDTKTNETVVAS